MPERKIGGCIRGPEDHRDFRMICGARDLPRKVDLREMCSPVEHQGQLNSCTANATVGAMEMLERRQGIEQRDLSRLFVYWNTRVIDGSTDKDIGSYISNAMKAVQRNGACLETVWPYDTSTVFTKPKWEAYQDGLTRQAIEYARVDQGPGVLQTLSRGFPVVFGMMLFASFDPVAGRTGVAPIPQPGEHRVGGHAMLIVGYDLDEQMYLVRNSWGTGWGDGGYCKIPFAMVDDPGMSWDFWAVLSMEDGGDYEIVKPPNRGEQRRQLSEWLKRLTGVPGWIAGKLGRRK